MQIQMPMPIGPALASTEWHGSTSMPEGTSHLQLVPVLYSEPSSVNLGR